MRASDVPRATEPSLSTALRLRLSRRRKSTRRHWPRASLRRMTAVPTPAAGGLVLSHLPWEASCCLFPAALAAPRQAAVRATARTRVLPGAPSSGRARAQPFCSCSSSHVRSRTLTLQRLAQIGPRHSSPHSNDLSLRLGGGLEGAPMVMVVVFRFKLRLWTSGSARTKGPHETASNCMGVGRSMGVDFIHGI